MPVDTPALTICPTRLPVTCKAGFHRGFLDVSPGFCPLLITTYERALSCIDMDAPIVATVNGIDIWKEGDKYETYDGMMPLEEFDSLESAKQAARGYATDGLF